MDRSGRGRPSYYTRASMKPARFDYHQVRSVAEAAELLDRYGYDAKVLAGGQSLVPAMNFRLARPEVLVDINLVSELDHITDDGDAIRIGSLTRHVAFERPVVDGPLGNLLTSVAHHVGHLPIRVRGTFGGSLAHADPAAEWCVIAALLDAEIVARSVTGDRTIPARRFFHTVFTTDLAPEELLVETRLPKLGADAKVGFRQFSRRAGDFALAMSAVAVVPEDGLVREARIALGGVSDCPIRAGDAEDYLRGRSIDRENLAEAARLAADGFEAIGDIHGSAEYRRDLARVLTRRALEQAIAS